MGVERTMELIHDILISARFLFCYGNFKINLKILQRKQVVRIAAPAASFVRSSSDANM